VETPPLGDRYWYPLYEKLVELDIPAHIHSAGCRSERLTYSLHFINEESIAIVSLLNSNVFSDFPTLKLIVSHGGGAIPYQVARFDATSLRRGTERFTDKLRKLWFDTVLYSADALTLLFKTVGADRCMFGTERPGVGTVKDPKTGKWLDETRHIIEGFDWLSAAEKKMVLEDNAKKVFKLDV
jgi:predicted TIM-barrel fold metal-dependent hydrolase